MSTFLLRLRVLTAVSKEIFGLSFRIFIRPSKRVARNTETLLLCRQKCGGTNLTRNLSLMRKLTLSAGPGFLMLREILFFDL